MCYSGKRKVRAKNPALRAWYYGRAWAGMAVDLGGAGTPRLLAGPFLILTVLALMTGASWGAGFTPPQPVVAIHDSELTRALEALPAQGPTPTGAGTTGFQWWPTNWHYFVMPESLKEALSADGTLSAVVSDADIRDGALVDADGNPRFPILISLASEAIGDDEIAPLTNYVAAGGILLAGSSAFTRQPDGTPRGDFAIADALGLHLATSGLTNWTNNFSFTKLQDHRIISHIPSGTLTWQMPTAADEISWGTSPTHVYQAPHALWRVQVSDATVLAQADSSPYLTAKSFGKGQVLYHAAMQPLIGHGGWAPGMYAYAIFRKSIEMAFDLQRVPIPKVSPWQFQYNAAFSVRHDLENYTNLIANIAASAQVEFNNGAKGDYYFCTGALREEIGDTNAAIAGLRSAVTNYKATIGSHNGGLRNPNNPALTLHNYDYWHWGPDEALNADVSGSGYANGKAYAFNSISNSFLDLELWLSGVPNFGRTYAGCYFNATREDSYDIVNALGAKTVGDQKLSPFPHWTVSTRTPGMRYPMLTIPVSDWFVGTQVAQAMEFGHSVVSVRAAVDFYYSLGALINVYSHSLSSGDGGAGEMPADYVSYGMNTNLHPRVWAINAGDLYNWWLQRSNAQISATFTTNGSQSVTLLTVSGATDASTSVELMVPTSYYFQNLTVLTNGVVAGSTAYRVVGQTIKVLVGTSVTNVEVDYLLIPKAQDDLYGLSAGTALTVANPGILANDSPGTTVEFLTGPANGSLTISNGGGFIYTPAPGFSGVDGFTYRINDGQFVSPAAAVTLTVPPVDGFFQDDFGRPTDPGEVLPWTSYQGNWTVSSGMLQGGAGLTQTYGHVLYDAKWTNYSVECRLRFPAGFYGGGLAGRLDPKIGARYSAWVYPETSRGVTGGTASLRLLNFTDWDSWGYNGVSGGFMQQTNLPNLGTNWHNLKLGFCGTQIAVYFDGIQMFSVPDVEDGPFLTGGISFDMWSDISPSILSADDVIVRPLVVNDAYSADANHPLLVAGPGVLTNDTGVFGTSLTSTLLTGPAHGTIVLTNTGGFAYTPAADFVGIDSFTYQAIDGQTNIGSATVTVTVRPAITVTADNKSRPYGGENPPLTGNLLGVQPGDNITATYQVNADAQSPPGDYAITPVLHDPDGKLLNYAAVYLNNGTLTILPPNTPPVLADLPDLTSPDLTPLIVTNTASDSDIPANSLTYELVGAPSGMQIGSTDGVIRWTPTLTQSPSTNTIVTVVTDNGIPPLSATNSFKVVVKGLYDGINLADPAQATADLDGDGLSNLAEYALGTDPRNGGDAGGGAVWSVLSDQAGSYLSVQFKRRILSGGISIQYVSEVSGDGQTWFSDAAHVQEVSVTPIDAQFEMVIVKDRTATTSATPRLLRLRIVEN
jgi:hypothetical protein